MGGGKELNLKKELFAISRKFQLGKNFYAKYIVTTSKVYLKKILFYDTICLFFFFGKLKGQSTVEYRVISDLFTDIYQYKC